MPCVVVSYSEIQLVTFLQINIMHHVFIHTIFILFFLVIVIVVLVLFLIDCGILIVLIDYNCDDIVSL
jgi:hypothetical protein